MPQHEFGIIEDITQNEYTDYNQNKYNCISVDDKSVLAMMSSLKVLKTYFHSLDRPEKELAYYGTTIIPPNSLSEFLDIVLAEKNLKNHDDINDLGQKIIDAKRRNKYMIHFGI